nr:hypothetical protein [Tanacetum cinerariifolium]
GQAPEAGLAARIAGARVVAEQGQAHFAGHETGHFEAVGALHGVGSGPGIGDFLGLGAAEAGQRGEVGMQHRAQQLLDLGGRGGAGQLQL